MFRNHVILLLSTLILSLFACSEAEPKVTPEQASAFSIVLENQVRDMKIDFLEKNIMVQPFMEKINAAGKFKSTDRIEQQMRRMLEKNNYEKSIYDVMAGSGSFKKVKQYEKDGNQHIIYRVSGTAGFTYLDTELTIFKKKVGIADIFFFNTGQNLSATVADLMEKLSSHGESAIANQLENRFIAISTHLKNANYEFAKAEFDRLPYDIRNNRLYELRYLEIMSKLGGQEYLDFQQKLETKYSDDAGFQLMMIDVYINQKKYDKALSSINQLDSFINKDPFLDYHRGLVLKVKGDYDGAIKHFEKIAAADPGFAEPFPELVVAYAEKKDYSTAKRYFASYQKMKNADRNIISYLQTNYPELE